MTSQQSALKEAETLEEFLRKPKKDHELEMEYDSFDRHEHHFTKFYSEIGIRSSQYANVPLFDEQRVKMPSFVHASLVITQEATGGDYILAQCPLVKPTRPRIDTQRSLWRMIWMCQIEVCVSAVQLGEEKHCGYFFDQDVGGKYKVDPFTIITQEKRTRTAWNWTYYRLRINSAAKDQKGERILHVIVCDAWTDDPRTDEMRYDTLAELLDFVWSIEDDCDQQRRSRGQGSAHDRPPPTLVMSRAGQNRGGLYVVASIIGREMKRNVKANAYSLQNIEEKIRCLRAIRFGVFDRRSNFVMLVQTLIEIACRLGLVPRNETEGARRILRRCHAEIRSRRTPKEG